MDTLLFKIALNTIKYLGISLSKEMKDLYNENIKSLKKEIERDTKNGKKSCIHGLVESIL